MLKLPNLNGRHIVLGITGGIAAYKSAMLARLFVKAGAEVQVIMTPNAREFIGAVTMSTLTGRPVITEFFSANTGEWHSHVDLGLWADAMVIAPATASTIAKMATGVADNMLVTSYLSARAQVFVAPAMDLDMMKHPSTARNIETLRSYGNIIIEPAEGELASHLAGKGRMEEPEVIAAAVDAYFGSRGPLAGRKVMITAGPTYERIDPVRFIGNFSSGRMGYALANAAESMGGEVTLISGPVDRSLEIYPGVKVVAVESAEMMLKACLEVFETADIAVMAAAVADYRPAECRDKKIKRETDGIEMIELVKNPDIAATLGAQKRPGQVLAGFALETDNEVSNAKGKLARKNLDMIVLNSLRTPGAGFGTTTNAVDIIFANGMPEIHVPLQSKDEVALEVMRAAAMIIPI